MENEVFCTFTRIYNSDSFTELSGDYILPDILPDIRRVLHASAVVRPDGIFPGDDKLEYNGVIYYSVLYQAEDRVLHCASYKTEFSTNIPIKGLTDESVTDVSASCDTVNLRVSNPRKVSIRSKPVIRISAYNKTCTEPRVTGNVSIRDEAELMRQYGTVRSYTISQSEENAIGVSEDITVPPELPPVGEIVCAYVTPRTTELKASEGNVIFRAEASVGILYRTEPDESGVSQYVYLASGLPLTHIVTHDGAHEECGCRGEAVAYDISAAAAADASGEKRLIELDFVYDLRVVCVSNSEVELTRDMYSVKNESTPTYKTIPISSLYKIYTTNFSVSESVGLDALACGAFDEILLTDGCVEACRVSKHKNKLICSGEISASCVVRRETECDTVPFTVPYRAELDAPALREDFEYTASCGCGLIKTRFDGERLYADTEIYLALQVNTQEEIKVISELNVSETPVPARSAPITLCYPSRTDTLWDIAKKYKTSADAVCAANALSSEELGAKKVLLILKK